LSARACVHLTASKGDARQGQHPGEVLAERLRRGRPGPAPRAGVDPLAAGPEPLVELVDRGGLGHGDEQVPAEEPHGVLDGALLVAGVRVAEADLAAVVGPEVREQLGLGDDAAEHAPGLRGVVEHEDARGPPGPLEDEAQAPAEALGPLELHCHAEAGVRVGQRHDEEPEGARDARDDRAERPVVDLRGAGLPGELEVALARGARVPAPPLAHVSAHGRVGARRSRAPPPACRRSSSPCGAASWALPRSSSSTPSIQPR
jgi:hypothetical protein